MDNRAVELKAAVADQEFAALALRNADANLRHAEAAHQDVLTKLNALDRERRLYEERLEASDPYHIDEDGEESFCLSYAQWLAEEHQRVNDCQHQATLDACVSAYRVLMVARSRVEQSTAAREAELWHWLRQW